LFHRANLSPGGPSVNLTAVSFFGDWDASWM